MSLGNIKKTPFSKINAALVAHGSHLNVYITLTIMQEYEPIYTNNRIQQNTNDNNINLWLTPLLGISIVSLLWLHPSAHSNPQVSVTTYSEKFPIPKYQYLSDDQLQHYEKKLNGIEDDWEVEKVADKIESTTGLFKTACCLEMARKWA